MHVAESATAGSRKIWPFQHNLLSMTRVNFATLSSRDRSLHFAVDACCDWRLRALLGYVDEAPEYGAESPFLHHRPLDARVETEVAESSSGQYSEFEVVATRQRNQGPQPPLSSYSDLSQ